MLTIRHNDLIHLIVGVFLRLDTNENFSKHESRFLNLEKIIYDRI